MAANWKYEHGRPIATEQLAKKLADLNQMFTQYAGERTLGCCSPCIAGNLKILNSFPGMILAGHDGNDGGPALFKVYNFYCCKKI